MYVNNVMYGFSMLTPLITVYLYLCKCYLDEENEYTFLLALKMSLVVGLSLFFFSFLSFCDLFWYLGGLK